MFHMSGDSDLFQTVPQLMAEGWTRSGTDWVREADGSLECRVPLYEAKMVHHFDHRWATYAGDSLDEEGARDTTLAEKQTPDFESSPRYWVPESDVRLRAARVPASLKRGVREVDPARVAKTMAEWLAGAFAALDHRALHETDMTRVLTSEHPWRMSLGMAPDRFLREPKTLANGAVMQRETPLDRDDIAFLIDGSNDLLSLADALIDRKQPRWLMGWRDICRSTDERTTICGAIPKSGVGDKFLLCYSTRKVQEQAAFIALMSSIAFDYVARQKVGGSSFKYFTMKQIVLPPPSVLTDADLGFVLPRALELSFTSHSMRGLAEDLGHSGPPFAWDEERRAVLRAELDAFSARKYCLSRDELRYVLDPADAKGADYPSETFRVLKAKEESRFGEYRTRRLVLAAWDNLPEGVG